MHKYCFGIRVCFLAIILDNVQGLQTEGICVHLNTNLTHITTDKDIITQNIQGSSDTGVEICEKNANSCFSLWTESLNISTNRTVRTILAQGCWESSGKEDCMTEMCKNNRKPHTTLNNTKFCCCSEDMCNSNFTDDGWEEEPNLTVKVAQFPSFAERSVHQATMLILTTCFFTLLVVVVILIGLYRQWHEMCSPIKPLLSDSVHLLEGGHQFNKGYSIEQLKLSAMVGQGRYGSVWKGSVNDLEVAIKIFPSHYRQYYYNERDIYLLPFMDNSALLKYYGSNKRMTLDNCTEYMLVLSYCPNGNLQEYLRNNTLDLPTFCKMALSVAKGLAHLHTDIRKADKTKPCVCHRDLNTRNILVKPDLSCCICDLGLAIKIVGSNYYTLGEEQHAETKSINDVGTLRYMAPEVLEGAVNLRDCESSLKQIDVYALGLVLWELATRCTDLYQPGCEIPPYEMPFEAEIGHHPTFEQMQVLVTRNKARPLFPEYWRDCPRVRLIRETIEDCWDQDAEARLTSLCVEERLIELTNHSLRGTLYQSGVSPTVNLTQIQLPSLSLPIYNNNNHTIDSAEDTGDKDGLAMDCTASEGTVETLLTLSPSEPCAEPLTYVSKNSNNRVQQTALQPHQGRNPCIERNLMSTTTATDEWIDRSMKHHYSNLSDTQILVTNDYLNVMPRLAAPIPFLQNAVSDSHTFQTIPKQPNIPGNGNSNFAGILTRPLRTILDVKKNLSESKSNVQSKYVKDTEVSVDELKAVTALLKKDKENKELSLDLQNDLSNGKICNKMKVIISPFEERSDGTLARKAAERPSKLTLETSKEVYTPPKNSNELYAPKKANVNDIFLSEGKEKLKDLTCRIKTPGDVPPSVRRKSKGIYNQTRFSLYDDRMMEGIDLSKNQCSIDLSSQSFPTGIEQSGKNIKVDSSF
uniref:receptor protein serine/threonine kinase n=1 Tax=Clastoptera arizonana TaxID=38151 RepID=A0A1B6E1Y6_9HEMI